MSIETTIADLGLTITSVFVPWSQSRNKDEKHRSLNWTVTVSRNGRAILTTDYSAGIAHCPSYKQGKLKWEDKQRIDAECETGKKHIYQSWGVSPSKPTKPILPDTNSVLASLASDSDVLDYGSFEEWAENLGYDTDSRKAESIYRACLDIALKLRSALGDEGFRTLREVCRNY